MTIMTSCVLYYQQFSRGLYYQQFCELYICIYECYLYINQIANWKFKKTVCKFNFYITSNFVNCIYVYMNLIYIVTKLRIGKPRPKAGWLRRWPGPWTMAGPHGAPKTSSNNNNSLIYCMT